MLKISSIIIFSFIYISVEGNVTAQSVEGASTTSYLDWIVDDISFFIIILFLGIGMILLSIKNKLRIVEIFLPPQETITPIELREDISKTLLDSGSDGLLDEE